MIYNIIKDCLNYMDIVSGKDLKKMVLAKSSCYVLLRS